MFLEVHFDVSYFVIGGIDVVRVGELVGLGCWGVVVFSAICGAE